MKKTTAIVGVVSLALLMGAQVAQAQGPTCKATVSKRSIAESERRETTWDIVFDVNAPGCDSSRGQFSYVVEVLVGGRSELVNKTAEFMTENGQRTAVQVSYQAKPGEEVKNVTGVSIKECGCTKPGNN